MFMCTCMCANSLDGVAGAGRYVERAQLQQKTSGTQNCSQQNTEHEDHLHRKGDSEIKCVYVVGGVGAMKKRERETLYIIKAVYYTCVIIIINKGVITQCSYTLNNNTCIIYKPYNDFGNTACKKVISAPKWFLGNTADALFGAYWLYLILGVGNMTYIYYNT